MIDLSSITTMFDFHAECSGASFYMTFMYNMHYF